MQSLGPLTLKDLKLEASPQPEGLVQRMRESHHACARLVADGLSNQEISAITSYTPGRISQFRSDPTFMDLVAHYVGNKNVIYLDVHARIAQLGVDAVQELQLQLDEGQVSISQAIEITKLALDRAGHGPTKRSENLNLSASVSSEELSRLKALASQKGSVKYLDQQNEKAQEDLRQTSNRGLDCVPLLPPVDDTKGEAARKQGEGDLL